MPPIEDQPFKLYALEEDYDRDQSFSVELPSHKSTPWLAIDLTRTPCGHPPRRHQEGHRFGSPLS